MRRNRVKSSWGRSSRTRGLRRSLARTLSEPPSSTYLLDIVEFGSATGSQASAAQINTSSENQDMDLDSLGGVSFGDREMPDFVVEVREDDGDPMELTPDDDDMELALDFGDREKLPDRTIDEDDDPDNPVLCQPDEDEDCIEIKFALAACSRTAGKDPHPEDGRWISQRLAELSYTVAEQDDKNYETVKKYILRRILKILTRNRLPAHEPEGLDVPNDQDSDIGEEVHTDWSEAIRNFTVEAQYDFRRSHYDNGVLGYNFANEFSAYCSANGYNIGTMSQEDMDEAVERVEDCLGWVNVTQLTQVCIQFGIRLASHREQLRQLEIKSLEKAEDPFYTKVIGLEDRYKAWTAVEDARVKGDGFSSMTPDRYEIPPHRSGEIPMEEYVWFAAQVASPAMPAASLRTYRAIELACFTLRNYLRIHKPMEYSTGFHVHMGHKHGWNLLQLKRFATLWFLIEGVLIHLHRKDRESKYMDAWIAKMGQGTKLAQTLWHPDPEIRLKVHCLPQTAPETRARNEAEMQRNVDMESLSPRREEFIRNVWQYTRIDDLADAMSGGYSKKHEGFVRPAVRMRVTGHKKTDLPNTLTETNKQGPPKATNTQTVEVRTMHGTVDANHINHWLQVLRRLSYWVRRAPEGDFRDLTGDIAATIKGPRHLGHLLLLLRVPVRTRRFFFLPHNRHRGQKIGRDWFTYPDKDRVDWNRPFVVPTHGATHGQYYDDLDFNVYT
ncbi:hypothetical protein F5Y05DRAFT_422713 [Hypoxylon sp. FL0543]|nr:hypothetical protein F5Y05DRAFT_422713 [Hypoxylon sp. FL0543]